MCVDRDLRIHFSSRANGANVANDLNDRVLEKNRINSNSTIQMNIELNHTEIQQN